MARQGEVPGRCPGTLIHALPDARPLNAREGVRFNVLL